MPSHLPLLRSSCAQATQQLLAMRLIYSNSKLGTPPGVLGSTKSVPFGVPIPNVTNMPFQKAVFGIMVRSVIGAPPRPRPAAAAAAAAPARKPGDAALGHIGVMSCRTCARVSYVQRRPPGARRCAS